jgi:hypothetical protein
MAVPTDAVPHTLVARPELARLGPRGQQTLQRVLVAAALLWCRRATWPTVRAIAAQAGVAPSTVLREVGTSVGLHRLLVEIERSAFEHAVEDAEQAGLSRRAAQQRVARSRTTSWRAIHPELAWLPFLAALASGSDRQRLDHVAAVAGR